MCVCHLEVHILSWYTAHCNRIINDAISLGFVEVASDYVSHADLLRESAPAFHASQQLIWFILWSLKKVLKMGWGRPSLRSVLEGKMSRNNWRGLNFKVFIVWIWMRFSVFKGTGRGCSCSVWMYFKYIFVCILQSPSETESVISNDIINFIRVAVVPLRYVKQLSVHFYHSILPRYHSIPGNIAWASHSFLVRLSYPPPVARGTLLSHQIATFTLIGMPRQSRSQLYYP